MLNTLEIEIMSLSTRLSAMEKAPWFCREWDDDALAANGFTYSEKKGIFCSSCEIQYISGCDPELVHANSNIECIFKKVRKTRTWIHILFEWLVYILLYFRGQYTQEYEKMLKSPSSADNILYGVYVNIMSPGTKGDYIEMLSRVSNLLAGSPIVTKADIAFLSICVYIGYYHFVYVDISFLIFFIAFVGKFYVSPTYTVVLKNNIILTPDQVSLVLTYCSGLGYSYRSNASSEFRVTKVVEVSDLGVLHDSNHYKTILTKSFNHFYYRSLIVAFWISVVFVHSSYYSDILADPRIVVDTYIQTFSNYSVRLSVVVILYFCLRGQFYVAFLVGLILISYLTVSDLDPIRISVTLLVYVVAFLYWYGVLFSIIILVVGLFTFVAFVGSFMTASVFSTTITAFVMFVWYRYLLRNINWLFKHTTIVYLCKIPLVLDIFTRYVIRMNDGTVRKTDNRYVLDGVCTAVNQTNFLYKKKKYPIEYCVWCNQLGHSADNCNRKSISYSNVTYAIITMDEDTEICAGPKRENTAVSNAEPSINTSVHGGQAVFNIDFVNQYDDLVVGDSEINVAMFNVTEMVDLSKHLCYTSPRKCKLNGKSIYGLAKRESAVYPVNMVIPLSLRWLHLNNYATTFLYTGKAHLTNGYIARYIFVDVHTLNRLTSVEDYVIFYCQQYGVERIDEASGFKREITDAYIPDFAKCANVQWSSEVFGYSESLHSANSLKIDSESHTEDEEDL